MTTIKIEEPGNYDVTVQGTLKVDVPNFVTFMFHGEEIGAVHATLDFQDVPDVMLQQALDSTLLATKRKTVAVHPEHLTHLLPQIKDEAKRARLVSALREYQTQKGRPVEAGRLPWYKRLLCGLSNRSKKSGSR